MSAQHRGIVEGTHLHGEQLAPLQAAVHFFDYHSLSWQKVCYFESCCRTCKNLPYVASFIDFWLFFHVASGQKPLLFFSWSQCCKHLRSVDVPASLLSCASITFKIPSPPCVVRSWEVVKMSTYIQSTTSKWIQPLHLFKMETQHSHHSRICPSSLLIRLLF